MNMYIHIYTYIYVYTYTCTHIFARTCICGLYGSGIRGPFYSPFSGLPFQRIEEEQTRPVWGSFRGMTGVGPSYSLMTQSG